MFCRKCGYEIKHNMKFCVNCGAQVDYIQEQNQEIENENKEEKNEVVQVVENKEKLPKQSKKWDVFAKLGFGLGLGGLIAAPLTWGMYIMVCVAGIVFSALGKKDTRQLEKCNKGLRRSIAGSIIGIILFIVTIVAMILLIPE